MGKKKKVWEAPLRPDGSLMAYGESYNRRMPDGSWVWTTPEMVPADTVWDLDLCFDDFDKGYRSAYRFVGTDDDGRKWPMSISNYIAMARETVIDRCKVSGRFGVVKRGANFSLVYLGPQEY